MARITIEVAIARADQRKAQREDQDRIPSAEYYRGASVHDLIKMWKTGKGSDGNKLTNREFGYMVEQWCEVFGDWSPDSDAVANPLASIAEAPTLLEFVYASPILIAKAAEPATNAKSAAARRTVALDL